MFVYLARPIDQARESSFLHDLTIEVQRKLAYAGVGVYRPHQAYQFRTTDPLHVRFVDRMNQTALGMASGLVAILPSGIPTLGTPVEIQTALNQSKPVILFTDLIGSVQVSAWGMAGAQVVDLNSVQPLPDGADLRAMLYSGSEPTTGLNTMLVKYEPGALPLVKAHETDAGYDLATLEGTVLHAGERVLLRTGVSASVPVGWWGRITGRSSARTKWSTEVHDAVIDAGYTGELKIQVTYKGPGGSTLVPAGTRLAQYILHPVWDGLLVTVADPLPESPRGDRGYGSSDQNAKFSQLPMIDAPVCELHGLGQRMVRGRTNADGLTEWLCICNPRSLTPGQLSFGPADPGVGLRVCDSCGRTTWDAALFGGTCNMPQPAGGACTGRFV